MTATATKQDKNVFNYTAPEAIKLRKNPTGRLQKLFTDVRPIDASSKGKNQRIETSYMAPSGQEFMRVKHMQSGTDGKLKKIETEWFWTNPSAKWLADERPR